MSNSAAHGALLLACYSLGLAIPFLLIALAFEKMANGLNVVKRHFPVVIGVGGAMMITLGVLIVTGEFTVLNAGRPNTPRGSGEPLETADRRGAYIWAPSSADGADLGERSDMSWTRASRRSRSTTARSSPSRSATLTCAARCA